MKVVKVIMGFGVVLFAIGVAAYMFWLKPQLAFADVATNFAAKKFCSCIYVAGLTEDQCRVDFTDDVSIATFILEDRAVRVDVLGGRVSSRAVYQGATGCVLLPPAP